MAMIRAGRLVASGSASRNGESNGNGSSQKQYVYTDERGEPLFRVGRRPGGDKRFYQNAYENGKYLKGLTLSNGEQARRVIYNLQQVAKVADRGGVVWMVEGEKDADRLNQIDGICATTTPGGADNFDPDILSTLYGIRKLYILYDLDDSGRSHARKIMRACKRHGIGYQFAHIPPEWVGEKGDITDALDAGYELHDIPRDAKPPGTPDPDEDEREAAEQTGRFDLSETPPVFQLALERANIIAADRGHAPATFDRHTWEQKGRIQFRVSCPCPDHNDHRPSFAISTGDDQPLLVNCKKPDCDQETIAKALGIRLADFSEYHPPDEEEADVLREAHKLRVREKARVLVRSEAHEPLKLPDGDPREYMAIEPVGEMYRVEDLHVSGSNTLIVAQYKTGKTTMCINLFRSLVNGEPFLGRFDVQQVDGRVCYMDYEMQSKLFRLWLKAGGDLDLDRMTTPLHLRGVKFPFWIPERRVEFVQWLTDNHVQVLIIDTGMRASDGLVDNWNDNNQMMQFTSSLDELKDETDIDDLFVVTHTGRDAKFAEEGQEHARGATRLEDWMDSGWYYTKDEANTRYMRAIGRGVDMEPFALEYESGTHRLMTSGISKTEHQIQRGLEVLVDILFAGGEMTPAEIKAALEREKVKQSIIGEASGRGFVESKQDGRVTTYTLTDVGVNLHHRRVNTQTEDQKND